VHSDVVYLLRRSDVVYLVCSDVVYLVRRSDVLYLVCTVTWCT